MFTHSIVLRNKVRCCEVVHERKDFGRKKKWQSLDLVIAICDDIQIFIIIMVGIFIHNETQTFSIICETLASTAC